ncbi:unnamed protein product [Pleuronectes platessa]|uniref:Uncharacterized protein n=1 Tax=Pleuronectes platessa TaxID=8262 RepID=A0A9N7Y603_PLEPL|nr:unnamed protein product [Pleuronectes platessa]
MATILQMGPLSSSALTTPFVFAEGDRPFNPIGRIIAALACSPSTPLPTTAPASHKMPHFNCVPWKPVGVTTQSAWLDIERGSLVSQDFLPRGEFALLCIPEEVGSDILIGFQQRHNRIDGFPPHM